MPGSVVGAGITRVNEMDMVFALMDLIGYPVSAVTWQYTARKTKPM